MNAIDASINPTSADAMLVTSSATETTSLLTRADRDRRNDHGNDRGDGHGNYQIFIRYLIFRSIFITATPYILLPSTMAGAAIFLQKTSTMTFIWLICQMIVFAVGCATHRYIENTHANFPSFLHRFLIIFNMSGVTFVISTGLAGIATGLIPCTDKNDALSVVALIIICYLIGRVIVMSIIGYSQPFTIISTRVRIPTTWDFESVQASAADTESTCCICTEPFTLGSPVAKLACGHVYHIVCIKGWLPVNNTCPICRSSVMPRQLEA